MAEHKRLADGEDKYHFGFGIDGEPQIEAESTARMEDNPRTDNHHRQHSGCIVHGRLGPFKDMPLQKIVN